jgi:Rod binding domain-containing protein
MEGVHVAAGIGGSRQDELSPRLVHAAHEFEAQMMKELLKPMTGSDGLTGEDSDASTGSGGAMGEFASEALGRALSERGGFGIATSILHSVSRSEKTSQYEPVIAIRDKDTGIGNRGRLKE